MSKIYVFAIGGTGARVLKSLTMLLAAGVRTNASEIVPIIIDPDAACGDKTDTVILMNQYSTIFNTLSHHAGSELDAFSTKFIKLPFPNEYVMPMGDNTNDTFGNYMNLNALSNENRALVNMLFSKENQTTNMTKGFFGNPNIGSVVLNQFANSNEFRTFAANFSPDDKIFIISSIFGGTGASGSPLLLKNLRHISPDLHIANADAIQNAEIGAITVLPYFNVQPKDRALIDSDTFVSKTKAALSYYERNLRDLNVLYYIGDQARGQQQNNEGGPQQRNEAHFVELAAALSIIDFANNHYPNMQATIYKEFGIRDDTMDITLLNLSTPTYRQLARPLTEFTLFSKYLSEKLHNSLDQRWLLPYANTVVDGHIYSELYQFTESFLNWERDMESQQHARRFTPFVLEPRPNDVFGLVKGIRPVSLRLVSASNWDLYNHFLNKNEIARQANQHGETEEGKFIAHLLYGTQKVISNKIKF